jgi:hypothetical protein
MEALYVGDEAFLPWKHPVFFIFENVLLADRGAPAHASAE